MLYFPKSFNLKLLHTLIHKKIASFHSNAILVLPDFSHSLLNFFNLVKSQFILTLLYNTIILVINRVHVWAADWAKGEKKLRILHCSRNCGTVSLKVKDNWCCAINHMWMDQ